MKLGRPKESYRDEEVEPIFANSRGSYQPPGAGPASSGAARTVTFAQQKDELNIFQGLPVRKVVLVSACGVLGLLWLLGVFSHEDPRPSRASAPAGRSPTQAARVTPAPAALRVPTAKPQRQRPDDEGHEGAEDEPMARARPGNHDDEEDQGGGSTSSTHADAPAMSAAGTSTATSSAAPDADEADTSTSSGSAAAAHAQDPATASNVTAVAVTTTAAPGAAGNGTADAAGERGRNGRKPPKAGGGGAARQKERNDEP
mmetsp:Transcript_77732/g.215381  ORF Transcript_77732/g.215381 Transcript_77732/m.215381 type:complete len:258 (+) Transcript_77732:111-884(+)